MVMESCFIFVGVLSLFFFFFCECLGVGCFSHLVLILRCQDSVK
jgi:hypothetical protein